MRKFASPLGIDFQAAPLARVALHLCLLSAALGPTGAFWLGAVQTSRSHAPVAYEFEPEAPRHIELPRVVIVAHRERPAGPAATAMAGLSASDCANRPAERPSGAGPIPVTLQ
jgi:hypothetical protein